MKVTSPPTAGENQLPAMMFNQSLPQASAATAIADRLFITKVAPSLTKENMRAHFAQFGNLTDVYMPAVPGGASHKGICFVSFADPASLQAALRHSPHEILGNQVVVDVAAPRGPDQAGKGRPPIPAGPSLETPPFSGPGLLQSSAPSLETSPQFSGMTPSWETPSLEIPAISPSLQTPSLEMPTVAPNLQTPGLEIPTMSPSLQTPGLEMQTMPPNLQTPGLEIGGQNLEAPLTSPSPMTLPGFGVDASLTSPSPEMPTTMPGLDPAATMPGLDPAMLAARQAMATQQAMAMIATQQAMAQQQAMATAAMSMAMFQPMPAPMMPVTADLASAADILNESLRSSSSSFAAASPPAASPPSSGTNGTPVPGRLFVTRVTPDMTKIDLQIYFQKFGPLNDVFVPSGGKGIAFVSYRDASTAQEVLQTQQHEVKPGKAVLVDQAMDRPPLAGGGKGQRSSFGHGAAWGAGGPPPGVSSRPRPY